MMLNAMYMDDFTEIWELLNSNLAKFNTFYANDCGYSGSAHDIMVNWVYLFFLKAKADDIKEDNPN